MREEALVVLLLVDPVEPRRPAALAGAGVDAGHPALVRTGRGQRVPGERHLETGCCLLKLGRGQTSPGHELNHTVDAIAQALDEAHI